MQFLGINPLKLYDLFYIWYKVSPISAIGCLHGD